MHKPTYNPIKGRPAFNLPTRMTNVRHQNAYTTMKMRKTGQSSVKEQAAKDYRTDLEEKVPMEEKANLAASQPDAHEEKKRGLLLTDVEGSKKEYNDDDAIEGSDDEAFDSSDNESDSDEDDEQELQAELERIRAERALAQTNREQEEKQQKESDHRESAVKGNPLLSGDFDSNDTHDVSKIKRRWNEDVVFKNQAREEPEVKKRFINDTVRSDFHRSFMRKFIR